MHNFVKCSIHNLNIVINLQTCFKVYYIDSLKFVRQEDDRKRPAAAGIPRSASFLTQVLFSAINLQDSNRTRKHNAAFASFQQLPIALLVEAAVPKLAVYEVPSLPWSLPIYWTLWVTFIHQLCHCWNI